MDGAILYELQPIITFSPVANFGNQSIFDFETYNKLHPLCTIVFLTPKVLVLPIGCLLKIDFTQNDKIRKLQTYEPKNDY